jgi:hypothetical protein
MIRPSAQSLTKTAAAAAIAILALAGCKPLTTTTASAPAAPAGPAAPAQSGALITEPAAGFSPVYHLINHARRSVDLVPERTRASRSTRSSCSPGRCTRPRTCWPSTARWSGVAELADAGSLRTTLSTGLSPFSAATLRRAHAMVEGGHMTGKVVVSGF